MAEWRTRDLERHPTLVRDLAAEIGDALPHLVPLAARLNGVDLDSGTGRVLGDRLSTADIADFTRHIGPVAPPSEQDAPSVRLGAELPSVNTVARGDLVSEYLLSGADRQTSWRDALVEAYRHEVDQPDHGGPSAPGGRPAFTRDAVVVVPGFLGSELLDTDTSSLVWGRPRASSSKPGATGTIPRCGSPQRTGMTRTGPARAGCVPRGCSADRSGRRTSAVWSRTHRCWRPCGRGSSTRTRSWSSRTTGGSRPPATPRCSPRPRSATSPPGGRASGARGRAARAGRSRPGWCSSPTPWAGCWPGQRSRTHPGSPPTPGCSSPSAPLRGVRRGGGDARRPAAPVSRGTPYAPGRPHDAGCVRHAPRPALRGTRRRGAGAAHPADLADFGADAELGTAALEFQRAVWSAPAVLPAHRGVAGIGQPTPQSLRIGHGEAEPLYSALRTRTNGELLRLADGTPVRWDRGGDGLVPRTPPRPADRQRRSAM
ncbi:hypothetical protein ACFQ60_08415 [Streptomyces zhihengii]